MKGNYNNLENKEKKSIIFENRAGNKIVIVLPNNATIQEAIEKYFERYPHLINQKGKIYFLHSSVKINENAQTKLKDFFITQNPKVYVIDDSVVGGNCLN